MTRAKKAKIEIEFIDEDIEELEQEDQEIEMDEFYERVAEVASAIDEVVSAMRISNNVAVSALSVLLRHATAQMYSAAYGRPELHEPLATDIEDDFQSLMVLISQKADMMARVAEFADLDKMSLPN